MSGSANNGAPGGVNAAGSVVSGAPGRQLTAAQKIGVAGLVLVVFLAFIWIGHLNKATQDEKPQPDLAVWTGGAFRPAPPPPSPPAACARHPAHAGGSASGRRSSRRRGSTR